MRPIHRRALTLLGLLAGIALLSLVVHGGVTGQAGSLPNHQATPAATGATARVVAHALPETVEHPELALATVIIEPGAGLASHHHLGTQIAHLVSGELAYTVESGTVMLRRGEAEPEPIPVGSTVTVVAGDSVIESPDGWHYVENVGDEPVEIWVASLFPEGAPRAVYGTPTP
jgi:quercetin dioxygenase-like cupin family protein